METAGFLSGVPLPAVRNARFINRLGTFFTLSKLIYNGRTYDYSASGGGAVIMTSNALSWQFVAPNGMFSADTLAALTVGQLLETVASGAETSPVPEWEDFASWLAGDTVTQQVNAILSSCSRASAHGTAIPIPAWVTPADFPALLRWIKSVIGGASSLPAADFRSQATASRFDVTLELYQLDADSAVTTVKIKTPTARPTAAVTDVFVSGSDYIRYTDENGAFSSPVLEISPSLCGSFAENYPGRDLILYAYEATRDTLGMGIAIEAGWYAVNMREMSFGRFDLGTDPIVISSDKLNGATVSDYLSEIGDTTVTAPEIPLAEMSFALRL